MTQHTTRAEQAQSKDWDNPDIFWVPEKWKQRLALAGLTHRWIRITEGDGRIDRRLSMRLQEGWKLVRPEEIPEWEAPPTMNYGGKYEGIVAINDAALAVCNKERAEQRQKLSEKKASLMAGAVRENLKELNTRKMPVYDDSRNTSVVGGRKVEFQK